MFSWGHNLAQSYQDYPTLNVRARLDHYLCFWPTSYQLKVPQTPMINLLQCLTELRKTVYLIRLLIYYKGQEWTAIQRDTQGEIVKELLSSWSAGPGWWHMETLWKRTKICPLGFYEGFSTYSWLTKSWPVATDPASGHLLSQEGMERKVLTF